VGPLPAFSDLRRATFEFAGARVDELKVWTHRMTPEGRSEGLFATVELARDGARVEFTAKPPGSTQIMRIYDPLRSVQVVFVNSPHLETNGHGAG
jgi:hypothetical protein